MSPFGLLFMMVALPMNLLSGATSGSRARHRTSPSASGHTAFKFKERRLPRRRHPLSFDFPVDLLVNFAQAILLPRVAGFDIVWRSFAIVAAVGLVYFTGALSGSGERWREPTLSLSSRREAQMLYVIHVYRFEPQTGLRSPPPLGSSSS